VPVAFILGPASVLGPCLDDHMHVIGHPAVGMDEVAIAIEAIRQYFVPAMAVSLLEENILTAIASQDDVEIPAGNVQSGGSRSHRACQSNEL